MASGGAVKVLVAQPAVESAAGWRTLAGRAVCVVVPVALWFAPLGLEARTQHALAIASFMILAWITEALEHALTGLVGCYLFGRRRAFGDRGAALASAHERARERMRAEARYAWDASPISTARLAAEGRARPHRCRHPATMNALILLALLLAAQNGKRLYVDYGCYQCHGREGQGSSATGPRIGPNPIPFPAFLRYARQPTGQMPPYTDKVASDAELAAIYAFLESRPQPPKSIPLPDGP